MVKLRHVMSAAAVRMLLAAVVFTTALDSEQTNAVGKQKQHSTNSNAIDAGKKIEHELKRLMAALDAGEATEAQVAHIERLIAASTSKSAEIRPPNSKEDELEAEIIRIVGSVVSVVELLYFSFILLCVWKRYPKVLLTTYLLLLVFGLADLDTALLRSVYWKRGEHLIPTQLSGLQAVAMDAIPLVFAMFSVLTAERHYLPAVGMTFDQWLWAEAFVCAANVAFTVCCFAVAFRKDDHQSEEEVATTSRRARQSPKRKSRAGSQTETKKKRDGSAESKEQANVQLEEAHWEHSETDFLHACLYGFGNTVRAILKSPDFDLGCITDLTGDTGLHLACARGHLPVVQMILAKDKKKIPKCLNARNAANQTPLMLAVAASNAAVVDRLLKASRIDLDGNRGMLPLAAAIKNDDTEIAEMIFSAMTERKIQFRDRMEIYIKRLLSLSKELASKSVPSAREASHRSDMRVYKEQIAQAVLISLKDDPSSESETESESSAEDQLRRELEEMSECAICNEDFSGRGGIFACENDHWLCGECNTRNATMVRNCCPLCNSDFGLAPPRRCRTAERLVMLVGRIGARI